MGKPAMCSRCSPAALPPEQLEQQKQLEVAEFFYKESRGQVDGRTRSTGSTGVKLAAQRPAQQDLTKAHGIINAFTEQYDISKLNYDECLATECEILRSEMAGSELGSPVFDEARSKLAALMDADERVNCITRTPPPSGFS